MGYLFCEALFVVGVAHPHHLWQTQRRLLRAADHHHCPPSPGLADDLQHLLAHRLGIAALADLPGDEIGPV